ncbi:MAG: hypothetical protein ACK4RN_09095 [Pseudorhodobacter sp.]
MKGPVFLARSSYRRRRLRDAARLLPVVGAFLVWLPMLWDDGATGARNTATDVIYLFAVWSVLILAAVVLSARLGGDDEADRGAEEDG